MIPEASRRAKAARWIISLTPLLNVCTAKVTQLGLGEPRLDPGPTFLPGKRFEDLAGDRIRRAAVWFVGGRNCGFHVDFCANGVTHIEAWVGGDRRTSTWISGSVTEASLKKDLTVSLVAAGLTDLARTEEVRAQLFNRTARK